MLFLSYLFAMPPRRRCRTACRMLIPLVVAAMMFAVLLMSHGLEPAAAVALSVALLGGVQRVLGGARRVGGRR
jgi:hypothetical protein